MPKPGWYPRPLPRFDPDDTLSEYRRRKWLMTSSVADLPSALAVSSKEGLLVQTLSRALRQMEMTELLHFISLTRAIETVAGLEGLSGPQWVEQTILGPRALELVLAASSPRSSRKRQSGVKGAKSPSSGTAPEPAPSPVGSTRGSRRTTKAGSGEPSPDKPASSPPQAE